MVARAAKRKVVSKPIETKTGKKVSESWCRIESKMKPATEFYQAVDVMVDTNGLMSVCKDCMNDMYDKIYLNEQSVEKAILRMCRTFNILYSPRAVEATRSHIETAKNKGKIQKGILGIYRNKLYSLQESSFNKQDHNDSNLTYSDVGGISYKIDEVIETEEERITLAQLKDFWGEGFALEDYKFLEKKISEWKRDYSCNNKAEELVIKELCFKELDLMKARIEGKPVDSIIKTMDTLLKSGGLSPAQTSAASGKTYDTIGMMIKQIEQTTPAEYYADKSLFKDFDGLEKYLSNYIKRPIMNFVGASKSFEIIDDDSDSMEIHNLEQEENDELEV